MTVRFQVHQWSALAPGLDSPGAWQAWWANPGPLSGVVAPALPEVPAMARRRIERLGRSALQVAFGALADAAPCPTVFASRYGDLQCSVNLMQQLARESAVSPTAFSMSVHNAFAALFSIVRADRSSYSAVSAGAESVECAFVEACTMLDEGADEVLVVYYDEPLPEPLCGQDGDFAFLRAFACRIGAVPDGAGISLACVPAPTKHAVSSVADSPMTPDLALLRFLAGTDRSHRRQVDGREWQWSRA